MLKRARRHRWLRDDPVMMTFLPFSVGPPTPVLMYRMPFVVPFPSFTATSWYYTRSLHCA